VKQVVHIALMLTVALFWAYVLVALLWPIVGAWLARLRRAARAREEKQRCSVCGEERWCAARKRFAKLEDGTGSLTEARAGDVAPEACGASTGAEGQGGGL
jgi:hypothetical protein